MRTDTYRPCLQPGEVMASYGLAEVLESHSDDFAPGDIVDGNFGWQDYAIVDAEAVRRRQPGIPLEWLAGVLNLMGFAAHVGLFEVARPRPGDTVVVSGAGGQQAASPCNWRGSPDVASWQSLVTLPSADGWSMSWARTSRSITSRAIWSGSCRGLSAFACRDSSFSILFTGARTWNSFSWNCAAPAS